MISQERFNEKMDALDRENPAPLKRLLESQQAVAELSEAERRKFDEDFARIFGSNTKDAI